MVSRSPIRATTIPIPTLFFAWSAHRAGRGLGVAALGLFLLAPRLARLHPAIPAMLWAALAGDWLGALGLVGGTLSIL